MTDYKIPEELLKAILEYLSKRPYAEVAEGVAQLQKLEPIRSVTEQKDNE